MGDQLDSTLQTIRTDLFRAGYLCDHQLAGSIHLAMKLERPLLLEGDAGVGKTALATAVSEMVSRSFIRLQCFEGLDHHDAVYEWNYGRQLTEIRLAESSAQTVDSAVIYSEDFLIQKPILRALKEQEGAVLLIDEIDRSDEAFEAYLLEALSDYQMRHQRRKNRCVATSAYTYFSRPCCNQLKNNEVLTALKCTVAS